MYFGYICFSDNWGKSFFFAVPGHFYANYINSRTSQYELSLTVMSRENGNVTILAKGQNMKTKYSITKGESSLVVPETIVQSYGQPSIQRKGIRITSTTMISAKLTVAGKYQENNYAYWETFKGEIDLLPASTFSSQYTIPFHEGMIGIHIVGIRKTGFIVTYEKNGKRQVIEGKLRKFDSFLFNETFPSGINLISSDEPVAVFSHAASRRNYDTKYQYVNQISTAATGSKYIIPSEPYHFKAVALDNGTIIEVKSDSRQYNMMLNAGEYIQSAIKVQAIGLSSNKDIIVSRYYFQYAYCQPIITSVPALSQYSNGYALPENSYGDLTVIVTSDQEDEFMFHMRNVPSWKKVSYFVMNGIKYFVATASLDKDDIVRKIHLRTRNATFVDSLVHIH